MFSSPSNRTTKPWCSGKVPPWLSTRTGVTWPMPHEGDWLGLVQSGVQAPLEETSFTGTVKEHRIQGQELRAWPWLCQSWCVLWTGSSHLWPQGSHLPVCPPPDTYRVIFHPKPRARGLVKSTSQCRRQAGGRGAHGHRAPRHCQGLWGITGENISVKPSEPLGQLRPSPVTHSSPNAVKLGASFPENVSTQGHPIP